MGSRICPLLWQNCSITAADSLAARVIIWYVFFTAVGSFSDLVWQPDSIETGATAAYQPSTTSGAQSESASIASPATASSPKIPYGLAVRLVITAALNSETANEGDPVEMQVVDDVTVGDRIVIPAGSKATGAVHSSRRRGRN